MKILLFLSLDFSFLKLAPEGLGTRCIQGRNLCPSLACNNALRNETSKAATTKPKECPYVTEDAPASGLARLQSTRHTE